MKINNKIHKKKQNFNINYPSAVNDFLRNRFLQYLAGCFFLVWLITAISPYDRFDWFLENLLVFVFLIILIVIYPRFQFSNLSYFLIALFMSFHLVGAHYSYTETPLDTILKEVFDFDRDHYDRIVHFLFGLLIVFPIFEALIKVVKIRRLWAETLSISIILAASSLYELIEMWVAKIVSPELGVLFLGTQGDLWDTQNDMAMALYGSLIAIFIMIIIHYLVNISANKRKYIGFGG